MGFRPQQKPETSLLILIVLVLYIVTNALFSSETIPYYSQSKPLLSKREPRLGDGCYHVFLDVGANVGVHGRFLLEPGKYPLSESSVPLFCKEYGHSLDNRDVCVFAFEANHKHWPRLAEVSEAYSRMGWKYHIVEAAVSDQPGSAAFFHQGEEDDKFNEWGFSGARNENLKGGYSVEVPTIRLSEWVLHHIHERFVPKPKKNDSNSSSTDVNADAESSAPHPILGMKMDIEGFEYVVLPDLIHTGTICNFDFVFGEFHPRFAPIRQFNSTENGNNADLNLQVSLENYHEVQSYATSISQVMMASRNCPVCWKNIDDESYLRDRQPLPNSDNGDSMP